MKCGECRFFSPGERFEGVWEHECHRWPPDADGRWPALSSESGWCGEFKPNAAKVFESWTRNEIP